MDDRPPTPPAQVPAMDGTRAAARRLDGPLRVWRFDGPHPVARPVLGGANGTGPRRPPPGEPRTDA